MLVYSWNCTLLFLYNMNEYGSIFHLRLQCYSWELTTLCLESRSRETWQQPQGVPPVALPRLLRDQNQSKKRDKKPEPSQWQSDVCNDTVFISLESVPSIREQIFWMLANVNCDLVFAYFMRQFDVFCISYLSNKTPLWKWK